MKNHLIIDKVHSMSDDKVCDLINFNFGIKMYDVNQAMIDHKIHLPKCKWCRDCKGHWHMPQMRDLLISLMST